MKHLDPQVLKALDLTPAQAKENQKQNNENKMKKKYTLTIMKDGIYPEVSDEDFEEFKRLCP